MKSLDPRINRLNTPHENHETNIPAQDYWHTYEVFHQEKRGKHHAHVGSVHAPNPEMALIFAKEQYARRKQCVNMWVVKTADVFSFRMEDEDMFATTPEKTHREAGMYKVRERIQEYKDKQTKSTS